jgi:hypothetical protein
VSTAASPALMFDPLTHRYTVDGVEVPSVTTILHNSGLTSYGDIPMAVLERKRALGAAVHAFTAAMDQGTEEWDQVIGSDLEAYCMAWDRFKSDTRFTPRLVEHQLLAEKHGMRYAGTLDREGELNGQSTVIELKCAAQAQSWWPLQLMAYALALQQPARTPPRRAAVQLMPDGSYKLHAYSNSTDQGVWLAALALEVWRRNGGKR